MLRFFGGFSFALHPPIETLNRFCDGLLNFIAATYSRSWSAGAAHGKFICGMAWLLYVILVIDLACGSSWLIMLGIQELVKSPDPSIY